MKGRNENVQKEENACSGVVKVDQKWKKNEATENSEETPSKLKWIGLKVSEFLELL
jgi:hypothetical protein